MQSLAEWLKEPNSEARSIPDGECAVRRLVFAGVSKESRARLVIATLDAPEIRLPNGCDRRRKSNAHEEPGKCLRKVFTIWRVQGESRVTPAFKE